MRMDLVVRQRRRLTKAIWQLVLGADSPLLVEPGQFLHIRVGSGTSHALRRPISIAEVNGDQVTIVFAVVGAGTHWLSEQLPGAVLDVVGPLGRGFPLPRQAGRVLVVGGGLGIPPLYELARRLQNRCESADIVLGYRTADDCFWVDRFRELGALHITTDDGSWGTQGSVTQKIEELCGDQRNRWSHFYACGPLGMLRSLQRFYRGCPVEGYMSLEERMACGVGACSGCVCQTQSGGTKKVCQEGPVFPWQEVNIG